MKELFMYSTLKAVFSTAEPRVAPMRPSMVLEIIFSAAIMWECFSLYWSNFCWYSLSLESPFSGGGSGGLPCAAAKKAWIPALICWSTSLPVPLIHIYLTGYCGHIPYTPSSSWGRCTSEKECKLVSLVLNLCYRFQTCHTKSIIALVKVSELFRGGAFLIPKFEALFWQIW